MLSLGKVVVYELYGRGLDLGEEGVYLPRSRWLRAFDPFADVAPRALQSWWHVLTGIVGFLGGEVLFVGCVGARDQYGGLDGVNASIIVVAIHLRRRAFVVYILLRRHVIERAQLVARRWRRQLCGCGGALDEGVYQ